MTGRAPLPQTPTVFGDLTADQFAMRVEIMHKMEFNALMRGNGCGVLTDGQLNDWLDGANVTRHPDDFIGFEILFGFDRHAQDFVVIKNKTPNGPHFALIADKGA